MLGDADDEPQVVLDHLLPRREVAARRAGARSASSSSGASSAVAADLVQVELGDVVEEVARASAATACGDRLLVGLARGGVASSRSSSAGNPSAVTARHAGRQIFQRIDRLAETPDLEVQLRLIGVGVADLGDLLPFGDGLTFLDQDLAVVRVDTR